MQYITLSYKRHRHPLKQLAVPHIFHKLNSASKIKRKLATEKSKRKTNNSSTLKQLHAASVHSNCLLLGSLIAGKFFNSLDPLIFNGMQVKASQKIVFLQSHFLGTWNIRITEKFTNIVSSLLSLDKISHVKLKEKCEYFEVRF